MNSLPFGQLKSFLKILIGVQYESRKYIRYSVAFRTLNWNKIFGRILLPNHAVMPYFFRFRIDYTFTVFADSA